VTHAYAVTNLCTGLAAAAFTPGAGPSDATRSYLCDGVMGNQYAFTSNASGNTLVIDFGSAIDVQGFAVLNSNIASAVAPTLKVEAASDAAITANVIANKAVTTLVTTGPNRKDHVLQLIGVGGGFTRRYWRLTWAWTGTFQLKVGEVFAYASPTSLSRVQNDGSGDSAEMVVATTRSDAGHLRAAFMAGPIRSKRLVFSDFTDAQKLELLTLWEATKGPVTPLLWIQSYEATTTAAAAAKAAPKIATNAYQENDS